MGFHIALRYSKNKHISNWLSYSIFLYTDEGVVCDAASNSHQTNILSSPVKQAFAHSVRNKIEQVAELWSQKELWHNNILWEILLSIPSRLVSVLKTARPML